MKATTNISELEVILERNKQQRWTPEIDRVILDYYIQFARDRDVKALVAFINKKYDRQYIAPMLSKRYYYIKDNAAN